MTALTKAEMAEQLFEDLGPTSVKPKKSLRRSLRKFDNPSRIMSRSSQFGNFDLRDKRSRPGRNPKTGQDIPISARRVVTFKPGQKLKARVETYAGHADSE